MVSAITYRARGSTKHSIDLFLFLPIERHSDYLDSSKKQKDGADWRVISSFKHGGAVRASSAHRTSSRLGCAQDKPFWHGSQRSVLIQFQIANQSVSICILSFENFYHSRQNLSAGSVIVCI